MSKRLFVIVFLLCTELSVCKHAKRLTAESTRRQLSDCRIDWHPHWLTGWLFTCWLVGRRVALVGILRCSADWLHCIQELSSLLNSKNTLIACIPYKSPNLNQPKSFPNYTAVNKDQPGDKGGGELVTLIHHSIPSNSLFTITATTAY